MTYYPETIEIRNKPQRRQKALKRLRDEIRPELVKITDADTVLSVSRKELFEQVSFILSEMLRKYTFKLSGEEIREMAQTLSIDLAANCQGQLSHKTIN